MTIEEMRTIDAVKTYKELEDAREQIKRLIAERDTARRQADQQYKLREEFRDLLGTDDVERGVAVVREMKERIKRLEEAGDRMFRLLEHDGFESVGQNMWKQAKEAKP